MHVTRLAIGLFTACSAFALSNAPANAQKAHAMIATGGTQAPPPCAVGGNNPAFGAVYRMILPRRLNFSGVDRKIYAEDRVTTDPAGAADNGDDDENGKRNRKVSAGLEPFHLYFKKYIAPTSTTPASGDFPSVPDYILVKIIIPAKSDYTFWTQTVLDPGTPGLIQGVAVPKDRPGAEQIICGLNPIKIPGSGRQVATFFIDRNKLQLSPMTSSPGAPNILFNIIITPNDFPNTPIIIDPKIYNEG